MFNNGSSTIDCVVRNISDSGALLRVEGAIRIPDTFDLLIDENERHACRVAWRKLDAIGVAFLAE